jgi:ubiquinone biosynthesis protein UbiJ
VLACGDGLGADAVIAGSPLALLDLFGRRGDGASGSRGAQRLQISGDAEIAARYRELLELARPDWEEELSRLVGDLPARRISLAAQSALSWARKLARTASENLSEYLQEESRDLVSKPELEEFLVEVDELRETADRVEVRLARLERRLEGRLEGSP